MRGPPEAIRECRRDEVDEVVALWEVCGLTRPWNDPRADFALALNDAASTVLVALEGASVVATVMVGFDGHRGWIYYLAVSPSLRRRGLGGLMTSAAERWLQVRGAPKVQLMVRKDNQSVVGFYERLGFERQETIVFGKRLKALQD